MTSGFLDKFIERVGRIGPENVQSYLLRLADEKGFLENIFNAIQEGVIVTDAKGRIIISTTRRARCSGWRRKTRWGNCSRSGFAGWTGIAGNRGNDNEPRHGGVLSAAPVPEFLRGAAVPAEKGAEEGTRATR